MPKDGQTPIKNKGGSVAAAVQEVLGMRLKSLRLARRLSLRDLAEATGTSASFISQLERGLTGASTASLNQMASALGVSVALLFAESAAQNHHGVLRRASGRACRPATAAARCCFRGPR